MPDGARVAETNRPRAEVNGRGSVATTDNGPVEEVGREVDSRPTGPAMDPRVVARLPAGQQVRLLQHMQRGYGNAQVARMVSQLQTPPTRRATDDRDASLVSPASAPPQTTSDASAPVQRAVAALVPLRPQEIHPSPTVESAVQSDRPDPEFGEGREEQPVQRLVEGVGAPAAPPNGNGIVQRSSYVLNKAAEWAHDVPGYSLLTVILGKDPINDEAVPRTAVNFVHGVISLIPGGDAIFKNLQDSGALDQAFQWLNTETAKLGITWGAVKGALQKVLDSIGIADLADPGAAWDRVKHIIMPLIDKVKQFAVDAGKKLFEFVLEGALKMAGPLAGTIMAAIKKAGDVINTIAKDPVAFLGNLLRAVKGGFEQFMGNIETHLKQGLMGWLFGSLAGAGIELPKSFDLKGILSLVLQILGLSWQNLRTKLVGALGEPVVSAVEKTVGFVKTIASEGIGAAWQQIVQWITESIGSLKDMVLGAIKDWVVSTIIKQAVMKLVSMFNPVGAIIQAIITIYNTVEFVIDKAKQIADLANAVLDSIANIASGNVGAAANYVEQTLGKAVPVVIGFLADLIGLGGITDKIKEIIQKIRQPIDKVMGKMVGFVASKAKPIIEKMKQKGQAIVGGIKKTVGAVTGKVVGAAHAVVGWWRSREKVELADGEAHTLYFQGEGPDASLMIASNPTSYLEFVKGIDVRGKPPEVAKAKGEAVTVVQEIDSLKRRPSGRGDQGSHIRALLRQLATLTKQMSAAYPKVPPSSIRYGGVTGDGGGKSVKAGPLSKKHQPGSVPTDSAPIWQKARRRAGTFVQGHLLNENLGGEGRAYNLTPITIATNNRHKDDVETDIKDAVSNGKVVSYEVTAVYPPDGKHDSRKSKRDDLKQRIDDAKKLGTAAGTMKAKDLQDKLDIMEFEEQALAARLEYRWALLKYENGAWVEDKEMKRAAVDNKLPSDEP